MLWFRQQRCFVNIRPTIRPTYIKITTNSSNLTLINAEAKASQPLQRPNRYGNLTLTGDTFDRSLLHSYVNIAVRAPGMPAALALTSVRFKEFSSTLMYTIVICGVF